MSQPLAVSAPHWGRAMEALLDPLIQDEMRCGALNWNLGQRTEGEAAFSSACVCMTRGASEAFRQHQRQRPKVKAPTTANSLIASIITSSHLSNTPSEIARPSLIDCEEAPRRVQYKC